MTPALLETTPSSQLSIQAHFDDQLQARPIRIASQATKTLSAIDFYSGVGGWSLGFKMAGIDIIQSYEWWKKANETNALNNHHRTIEVDIRGIALGELPQNVDIVVGSPPCVEFSYSNRGGGGDIADGLKDIEKFLQVVDHVKPKYWAMENVPRVAEILKKELLKGGRLFRFAHLEPEIRIVDACEWGVPQQRKRCIAGRFDFNLFFDYRRRAVSVTLGDVVESLSSSDPIDPIYGIQVLSSHLHDHVPEAPLSPEEERMNREMKAFHPIYNNMAFPDSPNRPGRTVTATCTRVSRESIVIADPEKKGKFRRLTVRERACLQSFPFTYQFYGDSHSQKLKMVGNAVPPLLTFHIAHAMLGTRPDAMPKPSIAVGAFSLPSLLPKNTPPDSVGESYPKTRRFRAALPHLRFKSGVRFELANSFQERKPAWNVSFYFGNSKNIQQLPLNESLERQIAERGVHLPQEFIGPIAEKVSLTSASKLQDIWNRRVAIGLHPYEIVDEIGNIAEKTIQWLAETAIPSKAILCDLLQDRSAAPGLPKLLKVSDAVLAGCLVGCAWNKRLADVDFNLEPENAFI